MQPKEKNGISLKRNENVKERKASDCLQNIKQKKNGLRRMLGKAERGIGSDLEALHKTHGESRRRGGADGGGKKKKTRGPNQCWKSVYDRWQTRVQLLFSPSFSPTLSLSFSLPLHFPSLTID